MGQEIALIFLVLGVWGVVLVGWRISVALSNVATELMPLEDMGGVLEGVEKHMERVARHVRLSAEAGERELPSGELDKATEEILEKINRPSRLRDLL